MEGFQFNKKERSLEENDFVFSVENCDLGDKRTIEYLDDLKHENISEYYRILEELARLDILKEESKKTDDYSKLEDLKPHLKEAKNESLITDQDELGSVYGGSSSDNKSLFNRA